SMVQIVARGPFTGAEGERHQSDDDAHQRNDIPDDGRLARGRRPAKQRCRGVCQGGSANHFDDRGWHNPWLVEWPRRDTSVLDGAEHEQRRVRCRDPRQHVHDGGHDQATFPRTIRSVVAGATRSIVVGSAKPAAINHAKPGNRVKGTRNSAFGTIMFNQLNSPMTASAIPEMTNHFGSSFRNAAGIVMPAIKRPKGTENPEPPRP